MNIKVTKNGHTMQVDEANLPIWTEAGWTAEQKPATEKEATEAAAGTPARQPWVDEAYKKYFDRAATDQEYAEWSKGTPRDLEQFLKADASRYGYTSKYFREQADNGLEKGLAIIEADTSLTPEMRQLAQDTLRAYTGGIEVDAPQILETFNRLKTTVIDPRYQSLIGQAEQELQGSVANQEAQRQLELSKEGATASDDEAKAKQALETSGLTFSGKAQQQLGNQSAIPNQPGQIVPFGGQPEGSLAKNQRLVASTSQNRYIENLRQLGLAGEKTLGSGGVTGIVPGYKPAGGLPGSLEEGRQKDYATTLTNVAANQQNKTDLMTNTQPNI